MAKCPSYWWFVNEGNVAEESDCSYQAEPHDFVAVVFVAQDCAADGHRARCDACIKNRHLFWMLSLAPSNRVCRWCVHSDGRKPDEDAVSFSHEEFLMMLVPLRRSHRYRIECLFPKSLSTRVDVSGKLYKSLRRCILLVIG